MLSSSVLLVLNFYLRDQQRENHVQFWCQVKMVLESSTAEFRLNYCSSVWNNHRAWSQSNLEWILKSFCSFDQPTNREGQFRGPTNQHEGRFCAWRPCSHPQDRGQSTIMTTNNKFTLSQREGRARPTAVGVPSSAQGGEWSRQPREVRVNLEGGCPAQGLGGPPRWQWQVMTPWGCSG